MRSGVNMPSDMNRLLPKLLRLNAWPYIAPRLWMREQIADANAAAVFVHEDDVPAVQLTRAFQTARRGEREYALTNLQDIVHDPPLLLFWNKRRLIFRIRRRNASRTFTGMTLKGHNAAVRHHEPTGGVDTVGAKRQRDRDFVGRDQFS